MKTKNLLFIACLLFALALTACAPRSFEPVTQQADLSLVAKGEPAIALEEPWSNFGGGEKLVALPEMGEMGLDVRGADLTALDLTNDETLAQSALFDTATQWPEALPPGFDPAAAMELGKSPSLGVRALHQQGITGEGIAIAIIDQALPITHSEYAGRVMLYEKLHSYDQSASLHGPAVASLAAGNTVGVAPGALLYHIACSFYTMEDGQITDDLTAIAPAVDRVVEINEALPAGQKIRVLSISRGYFRDDGVGGDAVYEAVERAKAAGIFVVTCSTITNYDYELVGLGRDINADPDDAASYTLYNWGPSVNTLAVPQHARTYASAKGEDAYEFSVRAGSSWTAPWLAGMYALCCQVDPALTGEEFIEAALKTGSPTTEGVSVIAPAALIEAIKQR